MDFKLERFRVLILLILIGLFAVAGVGMVLPHRINPIRIALVVNPGDRGTTQEYLREGALLAVEEVNAGGGINSHPLELLITESPVTRGGVASSERTLLAAGIPVIIGHVPVSLSPGASSEGMSEGILMFDPYIATSKLSGLDDLFFRTSMDTRQYAEVMAKLLRMQQFRSVVFLLDMSHPDFALEYAEFTARQFPGRTSQIRINPGLGVDWEAVVSEIQGSETEAVVLLTQADITGIAAQKLRQSGYNEPLIATIWAQTNDLMRFGGVAVEGLSLVTSVDPSVRHSDFLIFTKLMEKHFGNSTDAWSVHAFEAVMILAEALRRCTEYSVPELKQKLLNHRFRTLMGTLTFDAYGDVVRKVYEVKVADGKFVKVATLK